MLATIPTFRIPWTKKDHQVPSSCVSGVNRISLESSKSKARHIRDTVVSISCPNHTRLKSIAYLLDVVVAQGAAILELLAGEDQALLVRGDTLLVLDLGLDVVDGVAGLDIQGNGLTREGLDETISHRISPYSFSFVWVVRAMIGSAGSW